MLPYLFSANHIVRLYIIRPFKPFTLQEAFYFRPFRSFRPRCHTAGKFKTGQILFPYHLSLNTTVYGRIQDEATLFASVEGENYIGRK